MTENIYTGFTCYFDILGYKELISNNSIHKQAEVVSLIKAKPNIEWDIIKDTLTKEEYIKYVNCFKILNVSDSILVLSPSISDISLIKQWLIFSVFCRNIFKTFFINGMPLRGAISFGEFFVDGECFAGKAIMDCYTKAESINLSAVVFTQLSIDIIKDLDVKIKNSLCIKQYIPYRDGTDDIGYILKWYNLDDHKFKDIRQNIYLSFSSHNKYISQNVMNKLNNTEKSILAMIVC